MSEYARSPLAEDPVNILCREDPARVLLATVCQVPEIIVLSEGVPSAPLLVLPPWVGVVKCIVLNGWRVCSTPGG